LSKSLKGSQKRNILNLVYATIDLDSCVLEHIYLCASGKVSFLMAGNSFLRRTQVVKRLEQYLCWLLNGFSARTISIGFVRSE